MRLKTLFGSVFLIVGAYSALWYYLAYYAEDYAQAKIGALKQYGINFSYRDMEVSGFPFGLVIDFDRAHIRLIQDDIRLEWRANTLQAITQPWNFREVTFLSDEPVISVAPGPAGTAFMVEPELLKVEFRADAGGTEYLSFAMENFLVMPSSGGEPGVRADHASLHLQFFPAPATSIPGSDLIEPELANIAISVSNMATQSDGLSETLAPSSISIETSIRGPFMPRLTPYSLAAWRDAGGTIEVVRLSVRTRQAPLFSGAGSLTLDEALRPLGALSIEAEDMPGTLIWLRDIGFISATEHAEVSAALISLARILNHNNSGGSDTPLMLPVTLQDGRIYIGPIAIARLEPLVRN